MDDERFIGIRESVRPVVLINWIDDLLESGNSHLLNAWLEMIDLDAIRPKLLLTILMSTFADADHLPGREAVYAAAQSRFQADFGKSRAENMLRGLKFSPPVKCDEKPSENAH